MQLSCAKRSHWILCSDVWDLCTKIWISAWRSQKTISLVSLKVRLVLGHGSFYDLSDSFHRIQQVTPGTRGEALASVKARQKKRKKSSSSKTPLTSMANWKTTIWIRKQGSKNRLWQMSNQHLNLRLWVQWPRYLQVTLFSLLMLCAVLSILSTQILTKPLLPMTIDHALPHINLQLGSTLNEPGSPFIECAVDTLAILSTATSIILLQLSSFTPSVLSASMFQKSMHLLFCWILFSKRIKHPLLLLPNSPSHLTSTCCILLVMVLLLHPWHLLKDLMFLLMHF